MLELQANTGRTTPPSLFQLPEPGFVPIAPNSDVAVVKPDATREPRRSTGRPLVRRGRGHTEIEGDLADAEPPGARVQPGPAGFTWFHLACKSQRRFHTLRWAGRPTSSTTRSHFAPRASFRTCIRPPFRRPPRWQPLY